MQRPPDSILAHHPMALARIVWAIAVAITLSGCAHHARTATLLAAPLPQPAATRWLEQHPATSASFRGLSAVGSNVVWASGTHGTFLWTADAGSHWHVGSVPGASSLDFRDVHAVSLDTAYVMAAGQDTARIYKTTDRGQHWTLQYDDTSKGAFLDAIAFFDSSHGLALGDPVNGQFTMLETHDGGTHWNRLAYTALPIALPNEAAFAASGTALVTCGPRDAWFGTGGARVSRVFRTRDAGSSWTVSDTPIRAADRAAGIFSLACRDEQHGIAVGGNYAHPNSAAVSVAYTNDGGATWTPAPPSSATAYLSGVTYLHSGNSRRLIGVGTNGTAWSDDDGRTWKRLDSLSLNTVVSLPTQPQALSAGERGRVAIRNIATR
ncbi:MAG: WD40/YVTN/BNR-like repeat-containing protein [Gemmatimonadaceae bacterium]